MDLDIKLGNRTSKLHLLSRKGNMIKIAVDDRIYDLDLLMVERGVYSVLYDGESYNLELIIGDSSKNYYVNSRYHSYEIEIIDAQTKYQRSRSNKNQGAGSETISSPMPGKIIKILVKPGEKVTAGTINVPIGTSGTYYLGFNNRFSILSEKQITGDIELRYQVSELDVDKLIGAY